MYMYDISQSRLSLRNWCWHRFRQGGCRGFLPLSCRRWSPSKWFEPRQLEFYGFSFSSQTVTV